MNEHEFLAAVERRTDVESDNEAHVVADATLQTLSDRIVQGEAEDIASQLPRQLADSLTAGPVEAEEFSASEFTDRVETREADLGTLDDPDGEEHAQAVLEVLGEAVSGGELDDAREQLPDEFDPLFEPVDMTEGQV
ncbi:DUF2267 domain-containing protein [Haloarcula nitratireducens]|uniref:DUF2267 domain-containing protein n=1 Tax=Haloarcula nitratireducens TaxID=2487749 RepID=A0AAW4P7D3_9EURY|nr:DUF2267 domain-containing protein [Halomicroarcula nitratireducens]MBX0293658.1 DUF2267 domain-containing protein [Halomicroarcula nitratireducens]